MENKNIFILPTDRPTWLHKSLLSGILRKSSACIGDMKQAQGMNIYITSDEEIKEGDWYFDIRLDNLFQCESERQAFDLYHTSNAKKIILTTDQDLIKDGVQAIDDEFLEWFVKNPSCEYVEVEIESKFDRVDGHYHDVWEIIIPKEESKQESLSWDELIREAGSEEQLIKILKLPHIAPLVREAMRSNCKNK